MLPILCYNNMDGPSSSLNSSLNSSSSSFNQLYDENVILNSVRSRKKVSELPNCPVCSCTIRQGELESHLSLEVERLQKLSCGSSKRKLSCNSTASPAIAGPSVGTTDAQDDEDCDVTSSAGGAEYQRVKSNRLRRLRARRRCTPPPSQGECPVCNATFPMSRLQRHALRCLKRTGASMDDDTPDSSSEDESIDVENDEPPGSGFGAEYEWCGEWRVRATALQGGGAGAGGVPVRRASHDQALVVDGDEDTELYGPPQYSPSEIAPDADIPEPIRPEAEQESERRTGENGQEEIEKAEPLSKHNGLVEASAETRIQALKAKIRELESGLHAASAKCLICLGPHVAPAVSIQCWHVYCEVCWLQSLRAKKICPQCNAITTAQHLRRIYM